MGANTSDEDSFFDDIVKDTWYGLDITVLVSEFPEAGGVRNRGLLEVEARQYSPSYDPYSDGGANDADTINAVAGAPFDLITDTADSFGYYGNRGPAAQFGIYRGHEAGKGGSENQIADTHIFDLTEMRVDHDDSNTLIVGDSGDDTIKANETGFYLDDTIRGMGARMI